MRILCIVGMVFLAVTVQAQLRHPAFDALAKSDFGSLQELLDDKVEICYDNRVQYLDKQAAISSLRKFLSDNPPKSCIPMHSGVSKGKASQYIIGNLICTNGKSYRIFIYSSDRQDKKIIEELKIDTQ